ncbi:MAG: glycosyltransferase [Bacteroidota bacterium]
MSAPAVPALSDTDAQRLSEATRRQAVVTICTPNFVPGTLVTLYSFRKYNPWFQGDTIVIVDDPSPTMKKHLAYLPDVKLHQLGSDLLHRSAEVTEADNSGRVFQAHFYSLELFNLKGYDRLLFLDSDLLILNSLHELFLMEDPMICVGDGFHYRDKLREGASYNTYKPSVWKSKKETWGGCFNSGLLLYDGSWANEKNYQALCRMVTTEGYSQQAMRLQDQMIQNIYFRDQFTLVSGRYNYRLGLVADGILEKDGIRQEDAYVLHFTARKKPWLHHEALDRLTDNPRYFDAFRLWQTHWLELAEQLHNRSV